jgi:glycosyltransferase involved in cell wall biosynthesis
MTKISIAMATYNGSRFIRQQLDSFSRQSLLPSELIVCDDGSDDSTLSILSDFSRSAPFRVEIVRNSERLGHTANFLQAAHMCQGDLIAFSDQDDEWLPQKLSRIRQASDEFDALLFGHSTEWIDENGQLTGVIFPTGRPVFKHQRIDDFVGHAAVFRRTLLEMASRSLSPRSYKSVAGEIEFGHDNLILEVANAMGKVHFVPDVLMRWRVYPKAERGWQYLVPSPYSTGTSIADRIFPLDIAQKYEQARLINRAHSDLLFCIVRDLKGSGENTASACEQLTEVAKLDAHRADIAGLRARFYSSQSRKERLSLLLDGISLGQYQRVSKGGFRMRNALRDIVAWLLNVKRPRGFI